MKSPILVSADEAVKNIKSEDTVCIGGAGAGHAVPDALLKALGTRFEKTLGPKNLTIIHPCGIGDNGKRGLNHIAIEGLIKKDIGGFWGNAPSMVKLAREGKIEGYNFPQGVLSHLMRATAAGESGVLTKTGLHTFVDPRDQGGKVNDITLEDMVSHVTINGEDFLFFKTLPIDVAFIRGSTVDAEGNLTMEGEVGTYAMLSMAQAAKVNGGIVIAQVKEIRSKSYALPERVKVPGILIDYVVEEPKQSMTFLTVDEPAFISRDAPYSENSLSLEGIKKIVCRRAAFEIKKNDFINLGYGMADGVPIVAKKEGLLKDITFLIEQGPIGGVISTGLNFGAMYNPSAIVDDGYQFDLFHGGGLTTCFLGFGQVDEHGNVNSSRFANIFTGCGGFIDISQHTKNVIFCGSFATKTSVDCNNGLLKLNNKGRFKKFIKTVEQITFSGRYAIQKEQRVLYVTERAVFELTKKGLNLIEIAPGVDLQKDILDMMEFRPIISSNLKTMHPKIFENGILGLKDAFYLERNEK
ncbi:MAG: malonate decarboxylase subunit alpha [Bacteroidota bacterium]